MAVGTPSGASLLLLLGWTSECHRDVWPQVLGRLGGCPGSISVCLQASGGYCCSFPPLIMKYICDKNFLTLTVSLSLCLSHSYTHTIGRFVDLCICVLSNFLCPRAVCLFCSVSYRCSSWQYIVHFYLFLSSHFYSPSQPPPLFFSCLS